MYYIRNFLRDDHVLLSYSVLHNRLMNSAVGYNPETKFRKRKTKQKYLVLTLVLFLKNGAKKGFKRISQLTLEA